MKNISNQSKTSGPDEIPNRILKECATEIAIFQTSIYTGKQDQICKDWLNENLTCVIKKGIQTRSRTSLTSIPSKILELIICKYILKQLEKHRVLTSLNHGVKLGYSCEKKTASHII